MRVNLTQEQADALQDFLKNLNFNVNDYEIIYVPTPYVEIKSVKAEKNIGHFLKRKYGIEI